LILSVVAISTFNCHNLQGLTETESLLSQTNPESVFKGWHTKFQKHSEYPEGSSEYTKRFGIFSKTLEEVMEHNSNPDRTWNKTVSFVADRTKEEIRSSKVESSHVFLDRDFDYGNMYVVDPVNVAESVEMKKAIDWTPYSGPVLPQGDCGCCYAFSMTNAIETVYNIKYGKFNQLSRQQSVDCNTLANGCHGGSPMDVLAYASTIGLNLDAEYKYEGYQGSCKENRSTAKVYVEGVYTTISQKKEIYTSKTLYFMLQKGPVSIAIDVEPIKDYENGIVDVIGCISINHAMLLVGFGTDARSGRDYWLIKNNWGDWWGEKGFIRIYVKDDYKGNCFINQNAWLPVAK